MIDHVVENLSSHHKDIVIVQLLVPLRTIPYVNSHFATIPPDPKRRVRLQHFGLLYNERDLRHQEYHLEKFPVSESR
jgi:hypothetical protein